MNKLEIDGAPLLYCSSCESVHIGLSDLDQLNTKHKLKHAVGELLVKAKYPKSA